MPTSRQRSGIRGDPILAEGSEMGKQEVRLSRLEKIVIAVIFIGILVWAIVPGKILYAIIGIIVAITVGVSYLTYRKRGIEPFKVLTKKSYGWLKEEKQPAKPELLKVPPLSGTERARLINAVGNKCENPTCREKFPLQVHHIKPREEGGSNKLSNLIVICNNCHGKFQGGIYSRELLKEWISGKRRRRFRYYLKWKY